MIEAVQGYLQTSHDSQTQIVDVGPLTYAVGDKVFPPPLATKPLKKRSVPIWMVPPPEIF